tara:strand:- start:83 stop:400 length:318 start_codon:yes stop_codon:yes gene_type:complete
MKKKSAIDNTINMLDTFGEDRVLGVSIKSLVAIGMTVAVAVSGYSMIKRDIEIAKELPIPPVTKEEFRLQTEIIDNAILETKEDISEIKEQMNRMESRLFENSRR